MLVQHFELQGSDLHISIVIINILYMKLGIGLREMLTCLRSVLQVDLAVRPSAA